MNKELNECLCCGGKQLAPCLDLGNQPLANSYIHPGDPELDRYPLMINFCQECFHSQLSMAVDPDILFRHYLYVSGTSITMHDFFVDFIRQLTPAHFSAPGRMLELAANDGTFLQCAKEQGWSVLGVDPAKNLRPLSEAKGLDVVTEYWTPELALTLGEFDCIVAQNVFAHVSDPLAFLEACATCLSDNGKLFIQTSQGKWLESMQYDYWYHEHISAFSVRSMKALLARAGLFLESVSITPVHGGSHSFVITKNQNCEKEHELETTERDNGRYDPTTYHEFQKFAEEHARTLKSTLERAQAEGYKVVGFGAAAKGNTVLNFAGISLDYIVEDSLLKVGRLSPGMNIPICGRDKLEAEPDDVVIVPLAWNFFDEIRSKIKAFRPNHQDRFIRYFG